TEPGLGTLNATALTLEAMAHRGLDLAGLVIGAWPDEPGLAERSNVADLEMLAARPLLGALPDGLAGRTGFADAARAGLAPAGLGQGALVGRAQARVCVVGGGFAGVNTALGLVERDVDDVVLLEAREIGFGASGRNGGFVFVDDCNHDIDGLFAKSFEAQMAEIFGGDAMAKLPNDHALYRSFFRFEDGPPATSFELNGWGDDLVHDYLKGIQIDGRLGVLYSNKDYGCEWDYDWRNKRFLADDNTKLAVNIAIYALTA
ncbi:MAG: FAD-dependent oxidoreductase, partial [Proteobacteria bacterium]|nr:FAD-dependent oxidoreductase [Pseudomonadota bacterium]